MKKVIAIIAAAICSTSCLHYDGDHIRIEGRTNGFSDDRTIHLDKGWFVDFNRAVVDYRDSTITLPLYCLSKEGREIKVIK